MSTLDLSAGALLVLDGAEWAVELPEPQLGRVRLVDAAGQRRTISMRALLHHPGCRQSTRTPASPTSGPPAGRGRQPATLADLPRHQRDLVALRVAHLLEIETGFRGGDALHAAPGEPRAGFDPAVTTVTQRRRAKAAEFTSMDRAAARVLALDKAGYRTLIRWESRRRRFGPIGCVDARWLRPRGGHPSVGDTVREAVFAVHGESLHRSRMSMRSRERLIHQYVRERHGPHATIEVPSYSTLLRVWREWFGAGGARQRYLRSAATVTSREHVIVHRPGQIVALDTTVLPVKVRETVFGDPVSVHLSLAMDVYTRSLCAFRLTLVSDTAVDVAMMLRDMTMPLPMRQGWGPELEWPYPGLPAAVVAEFAGHRVAALPFFAPETVTTDHGSVYRNHHLVEAQRVLGVNVLPARVLRPTDKNSVERAFGTIRSLLFEQLPGYTGVDVADRGTDPEADMVLTLDQAEHLIATWIVSIWQNRRLGEHAPSWDPAGDHSPNTLFAAAMAQGGFALHIPAPELYYQLLPAHHVAIHRHRGVKIRGLWYDSPALDPYREGPSTRGGRRRGTWQIHRDPRDARTVFFQDPRTHNWHTLPWTGLPPSTDVPAFTDSRVRDMLAAARTAGLTPRTDTELLPVLLDLLGAHVPVSTWPTLTKSARRGITRDITRAETARTDAASAHDTQHGRPRRAENGGTATRSPSAELPVAAGTAHTDRAASQPVQWPRHAHHIATALDADRRRRRIEADTSTTGAELPPRLGAEFSRGNLLLISDTAVEDSVHDEPVSDEGGTGT
ncbi:hypothetical protein SK571_31115 [Lentzea sp. BCCO 10_0798]|uniref:Integrase catalytic domain-containing protein n=1 Tax=Lentzea kristufekii TaxID=3095430 RepID=A0ABU4TZU9_9PSEU|nr:hypothetical protein [Lentzea sp. BCCO 10_0798]MDX8053842.1 hypothetical protein [Lentzea sp. BCCO 10_0798]